MEFIKTTLKDAILIKPRVFHDERGFFFESYSKKIFQENGILADFVQDNHSLSVQKGVLRGLHFQNPPYTQAKLIRVTKGRVYDVIVDLRHDSETFGKWEGFELSASNFQMLFIPKGFAHGFITLEDNTEFQYKCDEYYNKESEGGIIWNDQDLNINWNFDPHTNSGDNSISIERVIKKNQQAELNDSLEKIGEGVKNPILSDKDKLHPKFKDFKSPF